MMKGSMTHEEYLAERLKDPAFRAAWAIEEPKGWMAVNVWRVREARGMTQQALAEAAGMKQPRIAEIERGDANPRLETLARLAWALQVPVARLFADPAAQGAEPAPAAAAAKK